MTARRRWLSGLLLIMIVAPLLLHDARRATVAVAAPGDIATYAGGGAGDGGGATNAAVSPNGVAADGSGNIYIAEAANCRVRRVGGGTILTIAGTGVCGFSGDGGNATTAQLDGPSAVALDAGGNVYIADANNCRIRKITGTTITTIVGTGVCTYGGDGAAATSAQLAYPHGVAVNQASGDLYIADTDNCRVRKVSGGTITTLAGNGLCGYGGDGVPAATTGMGQARGVAVDSTGTLYIADTSICRVRIVVFPSTNIFTIAGNGTCAYGGDGGPGASAQVNAPRGLTTDAVGDVYIADTANCRIRKVSYPAITIDTVAGTWCGFSGDGGAATSAQIWNPGGVAISGSTMLIADTTNCRLRSVSAGTISTIAGTGGCNYGGDGGAATAAAFGTLGQLAVDTSGNVFVSDVNNCRIRKVTTGGVASTIAGTGLCSYSGDGGPATAAAFGGPRGIAVDTSGNVYIADTNNCRIRKRDGVTGNVSTVAGNGVCAYAGDTGSATSASLNYPESVAVLGSTIFIADTFNCRIRKVASGVITTLAGTGSCTFSGEGGPPGSAAVAFPYGVAVDAQGNVFVADTYNCRVRRISGSTIWTIAGTGICAYSGDGGAGASATVNQPSGVGVASGGAVYIADTSNCRVRLVVADTIITTAGTGTGVAFGNCGFAGDGGMATAAKLNRPAGVAIDASGNVYVADGLNKRVRRVAVGADLDGDGVLDASDNCPTIGNGSQANNDRNFINQHPTYAIDDFTLANSDLMGDACDPDDDNDGIADATESSLAALQAICPQATAATNPLALDSDGDRITDGAECVMGSNPADAASKPTIPPAAQDPDHDLLSTAFEATLGTNANLADSDGDGAPDGVEYRGHGTNPLIVDSDRDGVRDGCEIASLNPDTIVNSGDQATLATELARIPPPAKLVNMDLNRDGVLNSGDQAFMATRVGPGKCP